MFVCDHVQNAALVKTGLRGVSRLFRERDLLVTCISGDRHDA